MRLEVPEDPLGSDAGLNVDRFDIRFHFDILFEDHLLGSQYSLYQRAMNEHVSAEHELVCRAAFEPVSDDTSIGWLLIVKAPDCVTLVMKPSIFASALSSTVRPSA